MTCHLPLVYANQVLGHAWIDKEFEVLSSLKWTVVVPQTLRKIGLRRLDLIVATIKNEPDQLSRCHPITIYQPQVAVPLSHAVLRNELIDLLLFKPKSLANLEHLKTVKRSIHKTVYVNGNRTDCRLENLREV